MDSTTLVLAVVPVLIIQVSLQIWALIDLFRNKGGRAPIPTWGWVVIILLFNLLGPVIYFLLGRKDAAA